MNAVEVVALAPAEARALTDRIKVGVEAIWELITRAYTERAWEALGYTSWDEYCTREFGTSRLRLPREERAEVVASLRESGLSIRAIASATGIARNTVRDELRSQVGQIDPPAAPEPVAHEDDPVPVVVPEQHLPPLPDNYMNIPAGPVEEPAEPTSAPPATPVSAPIIGTDGKTYRPRPSEPKEPRRKPITDAFWTASFDLGKAVGKVERLADDDRFEKNKDQIARNLSDLVRARDALQRVIEKFN